MVSCLGLIHDSHALAGRQGHFSHTACGLSIGDSYVTPGLFAADGATISCERCRRAMHAHRPEADTTLLADPKSVIARLVEQVLNANDGAGLADAMDGTPASGFAAQRLHRLHELFPTWRATIDELIAEGDKVVLRYHVACNDAFGLLGHVGAIVKHNQMLIFRTSQGRVLDVQAIVDDFGLWSDMSQPTTATLERS